MGGGKLAPNTFLRAEIVEGFGDELAAIVGANLSNLLRGLCLDQSNPLLEAGESLGLLCQEENPNFS